MILTFQVIGHVVRNKRCFLEDDAWKLVPWASDPNTKEPKDYLIDIFCDVPGILDDLNSLRETSVSTEESFETCTHLGLQINSLFKRLFQWRTDWGAQFSDTYFSVGRSTLEDLKVVHLDTYPFSTAIFFTEPIRVAEICLYNTVLAILHKAWSSIPTSTTVTPCFDAHAGEFNPTILLPPGKGSLRNIVGEICRTIYCLLLRFPGQTGALRLIFPVQVAYRSVEPSSEEAQWLSKIISHIAHSHGFESVKYFQTPHS